MKNIILSIILLALASVSCNQKNKALETDSSVAVKTTSELYSCPMHSEITGEKGAECPECGMELTEKVEEKRISKKIDPNTTVVKTENTVAATSFTINEIVSSYLTLKNALVKDDSNGAAKAGNTLYATFEKVNSNTILNAKLKNKYNEIAVNAKKHVKDIGENAGKIARQREYFALLSKEVHALIKTFGTDQKLYQDYCPMYNQGKDGYWISETKDVKNPYYGSEMLSCGRMVQAFL